MLRRPCSLRLSFAARFLAAFVILCEVAWNNEQAAGGDRYAMWLADGTRFSAPELPLWPIPGVPCPLEKQDGLASSNPIRLLRDRQKLVDLRPPYLVMANGDVLRGTVVQLEPDEGRVGREPHVLVQLESPLVPVTGTHLAIRTDRIRRIVGSGGAFNREPPPGTAVLADGRRLAARSIRWREYGLALLTAEGVFEVNFAELADVVFPAIDTLAAVLEDNLWAGGWNGAAIVRYQSTGGSILTVGRVSREIEQLRQRNQLTSTIYYYLQPAWADEPLALPESEIAWCSFRTADETPLSLLPSETLAQSRLVAPAEAWLANRTPSGGLLASSPWEADLGLFAHANSSIAFDLPPAAHTLELAVGLDRAVGDRGCVRCQVLGIERAAASSSGEAPQEKVLWDSGVFQGRDGVKATGKLDVVGLSRIVLVTSDAHQNRPPGADPLDIRDQVVWLYPHVRLDLSDSAQSGRLASLLRGINDWQLAGDGWKQARVASVWNFANSAWDPVVALVEGAELRLTRKVTVTPACDVLELLSGCPADLAEHAFVLTVDGQPVPWHNNDDRRELRDRIARLRPNRTRAEDVRVSDHLAYWWDLSPWRGQEVTLDLRLRGEGDECGIAWRGLALRRAVRNADAIAADQAPDIPLTAIEPLEATSEGRAKPERDVIPMGRGEPIRFLGQRHAGGYGMTRNSSVTFPLQPEYKRFVAVVGCCQKLNGPLQVLIDDQVAWEKPLVTALEPAESIAIDIPPGAKTLKLKTGPEGYYGYAAFARAGFVTK